MADKAIGIPPALRSLADRYARRYSLTDYKVIVQRVKGKRVFYVLAWDQNDVQYRIRMDKVRAMRRPNIRQVMNKMWYVKQSIEEVHGEDRYDLSLIEEKHLKCNVKMPIICHEHGVFHKQRRNLVDDRQGCPKCSRRRYNINRKYYKNEG